MVFFRRKKLQYYHSVSRMFCNPLLCLKWSLRKHHNTKERGWMKKRLEPTFKLSFEHEKWILDGCPTTQTWYCHKMAGRYDGLRWLLLCYGHQPVPEALTEQSSFFMATLLLTTYPPTRINNYTVLFTLGFHKFIVDLTFLKGPWKNRGAAHEKSRLFW